jgi:hypothetical protein
MAKSLYSQLGLTIFGVVILTVLISSGVSAQVLNVQLSAHGPFGELQAGNGAFDVGLSIIFPDVFGTPNSPKTQSPFLVYALSSESGEPNFSGGGFIPNADLTGNGTETLTLNTDTSKIPGFVNQVCDASFTCTDAPGGVITVIWQKTKFRAGRTTGTTQERLLNHMCFNSSGTQNFVSASAAATILGQGFSNADGLIGTNILRQVFIRGCEAPPH